MTERLQEILNRKPSKWGNLTVKEFERDIKLLQERVQELEETVEDYKAVNKELHQRGRKLRKQNKRYREAFNSIMTLWKYSEDRTDFEWLAHKMSEEARKALEGEG